jgi:hypothetical protein
MNGEAIAAVVGLINDPDPGVRWKVIQFLARASTEQLGAAVGHVEGGSTYAVGLCHVHKPSGSDEALSFLESSSSVLRKFALAAAMRAAGSDHRPLRAAATSGDEEIRSWAEEELERRKKVGDN